MVKCIDYQSRARRWSHSLSRLMFDADDVVSQMLDVMKCKQSAYSAPTDTSFYMFGYKTKPCTNRPCANMRYCTNYHHEQERRRSPKDFSYNAEPCPNVKCPAGSIGPGKWREPSRCKKGDMCCFAHTLLEQMYHPHIYKTILCTIYAEPAKPETRGRQCMCGYLCTDAHCKDDTRTDPSKPFVSKSAASATTSSRRDVSGALATT
eukprot:1072043_1